MSFRQAQCIAVLKINLPHRVAHRAALIEEGVFPPAEVAD